MVNKNFSSDFNNILRAQITKRNLFLLIGLFVLGGLVGFLKVKFSDQLFKSNFPVESPYFSKSLSIQYLDDIQSKLIQDDYNSIKEQLGIGIDTIQFLKEVRYIREINLKDYQLTKTYSESKNFVIELITKTDDKAVIKVLLNEILNKIASNDYFQDKLNSVRHEKETIIKAIKLKIAELEELQRNSNDQIELTEQFFSFHGAIIGMQEKLGHLNMEIGNLKVIELIEDEFFPVEIVKTYFPVIFLFAIYFTLPFFLGILLISFYRLL